MRGSGRFVRTVGVYQVLFWGFNPLHCGAVVASVFYFSPLSCFFLVSIPFIAGQWSLLNERRHKVFPPLPVSIPFIAGQWSLHVPFFRAIGELVVSIPFIAGQWSLLVQDVLFRTVGIYVSIPFIAGQWSLPRRPLGPPVRYPGRFNPLHCGAVVASDQTGGEMTLSNPCFNPLHCGAVVASAIRLKENNRGSTFQSPSLRGSGRFGARRRARASPPSGFNPLHCGAVVASLTQT